MSGSLETILDTVQGVAALLSVVIACIAIYLSIQTERRTRERFRLSQELQTKIATANIRPILRIKKLMYEDVRGVVLSNSGLGTAIITEISFLRGSQETRFLPELFRFEEPFAWDTYWRFGPWQYYLSPDESFTLVKLSLDRLLKQGLPEQTALSILGSLRDQLEGISLRFEYEDVLGNEQEPLTVEL